MGGGCPPIWIDGRHRVDCSFPSDHPGNHGATVTIESYSSGAYFEVDSEIEGELEGMDAWVSVWIEWEDGLMPPSSVFSSGVTSGRSA